MNKYKRMTKLELIERIDFLENKYEKSNNRNAGRKSIFTDYDIEVIKVYRVQGHTIKQLATMFNCSVGTIHKILSK